MTRWLYPSIALTLLALGVSVYVGVFLRDQLPEQVPVHWDVNFQPDGWVPRDDLFRMFLLMPAVMAGLVVLTLVLPWLSPKSFDVDRFRDTYGYIMFLAVALMGYLHLVTIWGSLGGAALMGQLLIGAIFLFFALLGNVLGRVRRNFWMGIRTPWTLASEAVWNQTHRVAAWLWVGAGLVGFAAVLLGVPFWWCFIGLMVAVLAPVLYSLVLYKQLERQGKV